MSTDEAPNEERNVACYVYGVVPEDVELTPDARGLKDSDVRVIRHGDIAALVSDIEIKSAIGRPEDLAAHEQLLDGAATEVPVLPFRFGAVMSDADAVVEYLLEPHHDTFTAALKELEGRAEYIVKARYHENAILEELLAENSEAARLREQIRGTDEYSTREERMRLGEFVHNAIEAKREADCNAAAEAMAAHSAAASVLEPTHEYEAAHVAFLVETDQRDAFENAVDEYARERGGRMAVRLLGPLAPYDFVVTQQ